ncbi:beta-lactamase family protein [Streptosporangium sp. NBC_01810]|uniref:serine hydrolase domain-containing protein n=1 Tax=Streptosporangium sp. NBC_01810 TaxID=2975951 RepID=UPI002DD939BB|nr:serine hydrolase domain-containing protein [Streptosporangium sp. NBC_01810]WSA23015.1 beta-lactamase family protein [Streptosporangium sp. NBC_01810]
MNDMQKQVQEAVDRLVESGTERGLQVAVYRNGEPVVDVVAGVADPATGRPVTPDTPFYSASTGKGVTSTVVHVLVERGVLGYDTPIVELWPEFGAHGKERATVRHALTHSAGVPGVPAGTTPEDLCDWEGMCAAIADAKPWWEPGTRTGYHPHSFGYIIGEIVRRATGRPISRVLREEVAGPLGVAGELFLGVPESELGRLARLEDAPSDFEMPAEMSAEMFADIPFFKVVDGYTAAPMAAMPDAGFGNRADVLTSDIPAGGTMSARAVARMYAALLGEVDGVRLVSPERLREITEVAVTGVDEVTGTPVTRSLGYAIGATALLDSPTLFGMAGSGGSAAYADTATGIAIAMTKNMFYGGDFDTFDEIGRIVMNAVAGR